jgi:hypothetical protein
MEFTWADCEDQKYFHVLDTATREITPVKNPYTMFEKLVYNDEQIDYNSYVVPNLDNKFVKVIVAKKSDPYIFDKFLDKLNDQEIHELKIAETFEEFIGDNVNDESISVEDTTQLLDSYVDAVDTTLNKPMLKSLMRNLFVEAQSMEIA